MKPTVRPEASPPRVRIDYVDGLRGLAVLAVVLCHSAIWASLPRDGTMYGLLAVGRAGVDVFLVLSGFCLFYPLVKHGGPVARLRTSEYLTRRLHRIAPPYYAALVVVTLASCLTFALTGEGGRGLQHLFPVLPYDLAANTIAHLTMLHGLDNRTAHGFDGAFWSISLEWQFYLLFLPLAAIAIRSVAWAILIPVCVTLAYRIALRLIEPEFLFTCVGNELSLGRWAEFAAGMAAAYTLSRQGSVGRTTAVVGTGLLSAILSITIAYESTSGPYGYFLPLAWSVAGYGLIVAAGHSSSLRWCLEPKPLLWMGRISYSIYLVHGSIMMLLTTAVALNSSDASVRCAVVLLAAPILSVGGGALFFWCVERHFLPASLRDRRTMSSAGQVEGPPSAEAKDVAGGPSGTDDGGPAEPVAAPDRGRT